MKTLFKNHRKPSVQRLLISDSFNSRELKIFSNQVFEIQKIFNFLSIKSQRVGGI